MTAKITDQLKRKFLEDIYQEISTTSDRYYVGIGRTEEWGNGDVDPDVDNSVRGERLFRQSLQSIKSIADVSYVVTRHNWTSGTRYYNYDDATTRGDANAFYVKTEDNQVYICLQSGKNAQGQVEPSSVKPTGTSSNSFLTSDGYVWKYLYTISAEQARKFLSANFMPVEYISDSSNDPGLSALQAQQATIREAAVAGEILGVEVINGGTGFGAVGFGSGTPGGSGTAPTVTITGDGTGATARAFVSGNTITRIELDSDLTKARTFGSGYSYADVSIVGDGTNATARAVFVGDDSGLGANPVKNLKATSIMFNVVPDLGEEGADGWNDWPIISADRTDNAEYRQIGVIKNPTDPAGVGLTATAGRVSGYFELSLTSDNQYFASETLITGTGDPSGVATAVVDDVDSNRIYFHQTEETGFLPFASTGSIIPDNGNSYSYGSVETTVDVDRYSGEIFYIENRAAVERTDQQSEDIKIIVTL